MYGGELIVDGAQGLARSFGLSERVIGLAIVGPGTSFPELIASIVAARQGNAGMVIGNVLGSNIFNVFFTLGITALIMPVPLDLPLNPGRDRECRGDGPSRPVGDGSATPADRAPARCRAARVRPAATLWADGGCG